MTEAPAGCEPPITPERTFALVVGVESYEIGGFDLSGPARDATRFADWLTGTAGVPQANVRLLLSPLARNANGVTADPATQKCVEDALLKDLPQRDGDLLWIYWAGHGFLDRAHQLLLPYSDATAAHTTHLNLTSALRMWQSTTVGGARFRRVAAIADACRIDSRWKGGRLGFGAVEYPVGQPVTARRQFVLYAARPGEAAGNRAELEAGQFTDTLLKRLDRLTVAEAVRDLVDIARAVQGDFATMKADGRAWQEPTFEIATGWDEAPLYGGGWTEPHAPSGARVLDPLAWTELGELLGGYRTPPHTYEAYRWAFEVAGSAPPPGHRLPSAQLTEIARDLNNRQGTRPGVPLVLPFVQHLASRSPLSDWAASANAWVERTRERLNADPLPPPPPKPPEPPALHVRLTPEGDDEYWLQLWAYQGYFENVGESERPMDLDAVRTALGEHLLTHAASALPQRIEFHVPYELLQEPFETWQIPTGRRNRTVVLGCRYEVVLRCPEERQGLTEEPWRAKWQWYETNGGRHSDAVHHVCDTDVTDDLADVLQLDEPPVCVLADVTEPVIPDALDAILDGGIPIAVWRRPSPATTEPLRNALEADSLDVTELPKKLKYLRVRRRPLALLWDNPGRIPDRRSLSS
ncbi:caspase family protein [Streptomyces sp. GXMU-J15]|uniref:Caspase family protein n=1 Tax=Streptomyces fuscus TaxID=3048495 RepID=A0ABT7J0V6_9ACTN|nr:caspase family protein [Streptomyces fuscus]MDL2078472.1 caspase family protein [Streptomyces fuscus]